MKSPAEQHFDAHLTARGPKGAWVFLSIPFDVQAVFGTRSKVPVAGTLNGVPFRLSLQPEGDEPTFLRSKRSFKAEPKPNPATSSKSPSAATKPSAPSISQKNSNTS